jgi:hypothetical protein
MNKSKAREWNYFMQRLQSLIIACLQRKNLDSNVIIKKFSVFIRS